MDTLLILRGAQDFGVWNVTYEVVSCIDDWAGGKDKDALGSIDDGSSVCCPADPLVRIILIIAMKC